MEDCIALFTYSGAMKGLEMAAKISGDIPYRVFGDPVRLKQVITNLLSNALKFTEKGHILLTAEPEAGEEEKVAVRFSVEDTGIGISEEDIGKLFVVFSQVDASTNRKYGGTGLGLSISQRLVNMMNGSFRVESKPGKGSCFSFTAKFEEAGREYPEEFRRQMGAIRGKRILTFLEDSVSSRILLEYLREAELEVFAMQSGDEGWIAPAGSGPEEFRPDMAIVSENAVKDGAVIELLSRWKREGRNNGGVLVLSGFLSQRDTEPAGQKPEYSCVYQPIKRIELVNSLYTAINPPQERSSAEAKPGEKDEKIASLGSLRVLLAEDTPANRKLLIKLLEKYSLVPDVACNGAEAIELCGRNFYDVVLMDCQMPEVDGFEATRKIRASGGFNKRTPIIAITADAMEGDREKCFAAGMNDYITKPIQIETLMAKLKKYALEKEEGSVQPQFF